MATRRLEENTEYTAIAVCELRTLMSSMLLGVCIIVASGVLKPEHVHVWSCTFKGVRYTNNSRVKASEHYAEEECYCQMKHGGEAIMCYHLFLLIRRRLRLHHLGSVWPLPIVYKIKEILKKKRGFLLYYSRDYCCLKFDFVHFLYE
ncbi:hypothetical protein Btru_031242 [Bulinus truncatus]|nr:hypothetical protein Btru_031242 [Bulinus truncatus]